MLFHISLVGWTADLIFLLCFIILKVNRQKLQGMVEELLEKDPSEGRVWDSEFTP